MADVFVSYARRDKERVAPLVALIEAQGWSVYPDLPLTNIRFQATNGTVLLSGIFAYMLNFARTRRLPCGGRIAHRPIDNYRGTQHESS